MNAIGLSLIAAAKIIYLMFFLFFWLGDMVAEWLALTSQQEVLGYIPR